MRVLSATKRACSCVAAAVLLALAACHHNGTSASVANARIPRDAARFSVDSTSDTTVIFRGAEASWLRVGMRAHAVDPLQSDALIARLTLVAVDSDRVVARITGKVSQLSPAHVVLVVRPQKSWWRDHRFWLGLVGGAIFGGSIGFALH